MQSIFQVLIIIYRYYYMGQFFKFLFASCLGVFLALGLMIFVLFAIGSSFAASQEKTVHVEPNSILYLDFSDPIPEKTDNLQKDPFSLDEKKILGVYDIVEAIERAAADDDIKGIYLNTELVQGGFATNDVIHDALNDFKAAGKFVISYSKFYDQSAYYISSVADKSFVHPLGGVDFRGFAAQIPFFTNMLDKVGIKMQAIYAGQFKSATEPFRLTEMSEQNKAQTREFLSDIHANFMKDISKNRNLSIAQLNQVANSYQAIQSDKAVSGGLIDQVGYEDEAFIEIRDRIGLDADEKIPMVTLNDYVKANPKDKNFGASSKIAVVYAEGSIVDGEGENGQTGDEKYVKIIRKIRKDDKIKAIVLRVNSPGGSAMASENMWRELMLAKEEGMKIVVSMGDYAASGGYYIAAPADKIYAQPNTLTGSIGVFIMIPDASGLLTENIGIGFDTVKTNTFAEGISVVRPLAERERFLLQQRTDMMYETFLERVSMGRNMSRDEVHAVAQGRVWTGQDAIGKGLVDELGGLEDAINHAAELAGVESYRTVEYPFIKDQFQQIMEELTGQSDDTPVTRTIKAELGEYYPYYQQVKEMKEMKGVQARLPFVIMK